MTLVEEYAAADQRIRRDWPARLRGDGLDVLASRLEGVGVIRDTWSLLEAIRVWESVQDELMGR